MVRAILQNEEMLLNAVNSFPSVSIILPFEPKMSVHRDLEYQLQRSVARVEKKLLANYTFETARPVIDKLHALVKNVDFTTYKRSIAIFVSPAIEKVYYLDFPVEERIVIDESLEIRELVYSKKEIQKFLLLVLTESNSKVFLGNTRQFFRIVSNTPENIAPIKDCMPEGLKVSSDTDRKATMFDKFFRQVDAGIGHIISAYSLPLLVMGTDNIIEIFRRITQHSDQVIEFIPGNFEDSTEAEIREIVSPYIADWKKIKQKDLLSQLAHAKAMNRLTLGIQKIWKDATARKGRLLIVEKNYMCPDHQSDRADVIYPVRDGMQTESFIKDAVDDILERMLQSGGDVEFVDDGVLGAYQRIALITY